MTKDEVTKALRQAYNFGQIYWQQADSEYMSQHKKADQTEAKFQELLETTVAALEAKDEPWEKFCDSHCVWTDHHPDCKLAKDEPVQEPWESEMRNELVALGFDGQCPESIGITLKRWRDGYAAAQRKPLTDEEIIDHFKASVDTGFLLSFVDGVRYAEAAHGIKGESV